MYIGPDGKPDDRSVTGDLAAGVPGSVAGLWEAHHKFGSRPWAELLAPGDPARRQRIRRRLRFRARHALRQCAAVEVPGERGALPAAGHPSTSGDRWRNPELAAVLRRIAAKGPAGFYAGQTAQAIVAEMRRGHGIITLADLAAYQAKWRTPITFDYRGYHVISMPPPSSGGMTIALMAHMLAGRHLHALGWHSPAELHLLTEAMRRGFAVRNHFLGDPVHHDPDGAAAVAGVRGHPRGEHPAGQRDAIGGRLVSDRPGAPEGKHTTHFSVVDGQGNAVALTTTINSGFGSASTVPGRASCSTTRWMISRRSPVYANSGGWCMGDANAIAPGKRMLSSMTPTIVLGRDGMPFIVTGASGGGRIITAVFQVISNVVDFGMPINAAVSAPRVHHQHLPDTLIYERNGLREDVVTALEAMHQAVKASGHLAVGAFDRANDDWRPGHGRPARSGQGRRLLAAPTDLAVPISPPGVWPGGIGGRGGG